MIPLSRRSILQTSLSFVSFVYNKPVSLTLYEATEIICNYCPKEFREAVRDSGGRFLYRGESTVLPMILSPDPDLLFPSTYNDIEALGFFTCLEEKILFNKVTAKPSNGHIGTADKKIAAQWGEPVSIWPLGSSISYVWPLDRKLIYPGICQENNLVINKNLQIALQEGKEILFATKIDKDQKFELNNIQESSFLVIPATFDEVLHGYLSNKRYGLL